MTFEECSNVSGRRWKILFRHETTQLHRILIHLRKNESHLEDQVHGQREQIYVAHPDWEGVLLRCALNDDSPAAQTGLLLINQLSADRGGDFPVYFPELVSVRPDLKSKKT